MFARRPKSLGGGDRLRADIESYSAPGIGESGDSLIGSSPPPPVGGGGWNMLCLQINSCTSIGKRAKNSLHSGVPTTRRRLRNKPSICNFVCSVLLRTASGDSDMGDAGDSERSCCCCAEDNERRRGGRGDGERRGDCDSRRLWLWLCFRYFCGRCELLLLQQDDSLAESLLKELR